MASLDELYSSLQEAVTNNDKEGIEKVQKQILNYGRDTSLDESFIKAISGKPLGANLKRIIKGEPPKFSVNAYAKILSSLITHTYIESDITGKSPDDYAVKEMYIILGKFINKNEGAISDFREFIAERYGEFL